MAVVDHTVFTCGEVDSKWNAILTVLILRGRGGGEEERERRKRGELLNTGRLGEWGH